MTEDYACIAKVGSSQQWHKTANYKDALYKTKIAKVGR